MSNYHFGDDYDLNYYPLEASDDMGGVDWNKVERVKIECDMYVKERTCKRIVHGLERDREVATVSWTCSECHAHIGRDYRYCPNCGAKVVDE